VPNRFGDHIGQTVDVYGPGSAGGLPPAFDGREVPTVGTNPTLGTVEMTERLHDAYAYSTNIFMRDTGIRDIRTVVNPTDIVVPEVGANYLATAPGMEPFTVMEDDRVKVSAVLVPHGVCYPSFAYRFDTEYGSVTLSGDTTYSDNILALAQGTDLLVHEAINLEGGDLPPVVRSHMLDGHVEVQKVGEEPATVAVFTLRSAGALDGIGVFRIGNHVRDRLLRPLIPPWASIDPFAGTGKTTAVVSTAAVAASARSAWRRTAASDLSVRMAAPG
jgi:ribonuclease BN (tRNA processing enzyme)